MAENGSKRRRRSEEILAEEPLLQVRRDQPAVEVVGAGGLHRQVAEQPAQPQRPGEPGRARPAPAEGREETLAQRRRDEGAEPLLHQVHAVLLAVAGEQLVAAVAREGDRHPPAGLARHVPGGHGRGVGERLVEVPGDPRQHVREVGPHLHLHVVGAEGPRHGRGVLALVGLAVGEAHRVGAHGTRAGLAHQRDDRPGVDPAGEEGAQRDVALQAVAHGGGEEPLELSEASRSSAAGPASCAASVGTSQ